MRMTLQLPAKAGALRLSPCEAEAILIWPAETFQAFLEQPETTKSMATKYEYFQEDVGRVYCGVLILGEGRTDGVFTYDHGRHFAYLPGARSVVDSILEEAAEKIAQEGTVNSTDGRWDYFFDELYEQMGLVVEAGNGTVDLLLEKLKARQEIADVTLTDESFDVGIRPEFCKNLTRREPLPSHTLDWESVLYQVVEQGHTTAFVCEREGKIPNLYGLLARAGSIAGDRGSGFAEALSLAAAESGSRLRPVLADEAEALSHDLGHGGPADQRVVIDLDDHRIRVEYDHQASSLQESLDTLAKQFHPAASETIQSRLVSFLAEHDGSEELYHLLHQELGLTNQEIGAMGFQLQHRYVPEIGDAYQEIVNYIRFEQETSVAWVWAVSGDKMLADERTLREIAGRLSSAGAWDTERIYERLTEAFRTNPALLSDQGPELKL